MDFLLYRMRIPKPPIRTTVIPVAVQSMRLFGHPQQRVCHLIQFTGRTRIDHLIIPEPYRA